jgi:hypothetical protein
MRRALVAMVVALMCAVGPLEGQSTFGSIVGVVRDVSQASVLGAAVQLRSLEDNSTRSTTSDQDGAFRCKPTVSRTSRSLLRN